MADALVSSLVTAIIGKLNYLAPEELGIAGRLKAEIENLQNTLTTIQAVLQDAEENHRKDEAVKIWLRKLRDAALDADDVLDEFATEAQRRRIESQRGVRSRVSAFFSLRNPLVFRLKIAHRLKISRERLDAISADKFKFHFKVGVADIGVNQINWRQTSSLVNESEIYGRDEETEKTVGALLADRPDQRDATTYAIWGMGGLGKTTLAQCVYNDKRVERHFELRVWVCVNDDFDIRRLTRAIIESIDGSSCNISELDPLQQCLREKIGGKKFLLVLDDVWNENNEKWDGLKVSLRCGAKGSTVIVTTRSEKIALLMATLPVHHIGSLSEDDSWSLFKRRAFGIENSEVDSDLESIGKEIVKKCGGVPLAIKALGSMMFLKSERIEWLSVKESEIWNLSNDENSILPSLKLSYDNLSPHLKQCFAYCSVFPKGQRIEKDRLIQLWMANGFIPSRGQIKLQDMGLHIFNELIWRSFFQDVRENQIGRITCKMHDLMHDLAQSIMGFECSKIESTKIIELPKGVRHLCVNISAFQTISWNEYIIKTRSLRSCIHVYPGAAVSPTFCTILSKQKYLRVLDFGGWEHRELPISIVSLKHLRYLDLNCSDIEVLPENISCLPNLQTLILIYCSKLSKLPEGMRYLRNLAYLYLTGCDSLTSMPPKMGQLTSLQLLSDFIIGKDNGHQIAELEGLNLGGKLSIKGLGNVKSSMDAKKANLMEKSNLRSLSLSWYEHQNGVLVENAENVLTTLQPHSDIKKLDIIYYPGSTFPNWMMNLHLENVMEISLRMCRRCEHLPALGKLPLLKFLCIGQMDAVKCFGNKCDVYGINSFPALERLQIWGMPNLEKWGVNESESFPCLRELEICNCPKLVNLPVLLSLKRLRIDGSNVMLLSSIMNLISLTSLDICGFDDLMVLPHELLKNYSLLAHLRISDFGNLKSLSNQLDNLFALKCLLLEGCDELKSLPEGLQNLNTLESLEINDCNSLVSFSTNGLRGLSSLRSLRVQNCKKFASFSNGVQYLTALEDLHINGCPEFNSLPDDMEHLTALQNLGIMYCEVFFLPEAIGCLMNLSSLDIEHCMNLMSLPEGMGSLTALKRLRITGCPHLKRRCKKESGEDWPKIAHIPMIDIS